MKIKIMVLAIAISMLIVGQQARAAEAPLASDGSVVFNPLNISATAINPEQEALEKPGSTSSRGENSKLEPIDQIVRSMPGTYTQIDPGQGAVSVNIRGMSGFGRVNTMVDGVSQNYYGSAPSEVSHGGTPTNQFGALIDPNFIVGVDVTRGSELGSGGINALAGSANFRTIGVDDVIFAGESVGVRSKFSVGNNGLGRSGMLAVAGKSKAFGESGSVGIMAAISSSSIGGNYTNGNGTDSAEFGVGYNKSYEQNPKSQLLKLDIKLDNFHSFELSGRRYQNRYTKRDIEAHDAYLKYHYTPYSELIDLNIMASTSRGNQKYMPDALFSFKNTDTDSISNAIDINNTSRFSLAGADIALNYGGKLMNNRYDKRLESQLTGVDKEEEEKNRKDAIENNPFSPSGQQKISGLYSSLEINQGIFQLNLGLNYIKYDLSGFKPACDDRVQCLPQKAVDISLKEEALLPSILLSAVIHPWFQPFASYAKTLRGPNPQEVFFSNEGGASMNPYLKAEGAETFQLGFNSKASNLIFKEDAFFFKASYFHSEIDNYIYGKSFALCSNGVKCLMSDALKNNEDIDANFNMNIYVNSLTPVHSRGFELEANYDAGFAYARFSFSREKTDQPTSIASGVFGADDINDLPSVFYNLDAGTRLLDKKLIIGGIFKYTGANKKISTEHNLNEETGDLEKEKNAKNPVIIDLYSSYEINKNISLRFTVQNLMNRDYSEALNRLNSNPSQSSGESPANTARGRTYLVGAEFRM
ncbi:TonB-dependent receptor domain-containing protein [Iodobacter sp.]|uniref:TonB-dependent receptor domain-containing protein n=1 Tax=Iodobacter sp. TaxID=1915058 RepID=UPI0025D39146|nr:TonB-dependent receptor [Iodobacter sp.]